MGLEGSTSTKDWCVGREKAAEMIQTENVGLERFQQKRQRERHVKQARIVVAIAVIADLSILVLTPISIVLLSGRQNWDEKSSIFLESAPLIALVPVYIVAIATRGGYRYAKWVSAESLLSDFARAFISAAGVSSILILIAQVEVDLVLAACTWFVSLALLVTERFIIRRWARRYFVGLNSINILAVGSPQNIDDVVCRFAKSKYSIRWVGVACHPGGRRQKYRLPIIGSVTEIRELIDDHEVDIVVIAGGEQTAKDVNEISWKLADVQTKVVLAPAMTNATQPRVEFRVHFGIPLVEMKAPGLSRKEAALKRAMDVVVSSVLLLALSPVLLLVAFAVSLEDGGPVIFRQARVGQNGRDFECLKFRSMFKDAQERELELRKIHSRPGEMWKVENDPRVTRVGRFIRKTSLDELPQLLNVLSGEMSLVGPRPKQRWEVEQYDQTQLRRLVVKPGVTGLSQVLGRSDLSLDEAVSLDLDYVEQWTIATDIVIALRTLKIVLSRTGSY